MIAVAHTLLVMCYQVLKKGQPPKELPLRAMCHNRLT